LFHYVIQFCQHIQTLSGDVGPNYSAIVKIAALAQESLCFEPGQQAGNVRLGRDHPAADGRTSQTLRLRPSQNSKDVVLRHGQP
jgi:hypothetical protein